MNYCKYCMDIKGDCDAYECLKVICSCIYIITLPSDLNELKQFEQLLLIGIKSGNPLTIVPITMTLLSVVSSIIDYCLATKDTSELNDVSQKIKTIKSTVKTLDAKYPKPSSMQSAPEYVTPAQPIKTVSEEKSEEEEVFK